MSLGRAAPKGCPPPSQNPLRGRWEGGSQWKDEGQQQPGEGGPAGGEGTKSLANWWEGWE